MMDGEFERQIRIAIGDLEGDIPREEFFEELPPEASCAEEGWKVDVGDVFRIVEEARREFQALPIHSVRISVDSVLFGFAELEYYNRNEVKKLIEKWFGSAEGDEE